MRNDSPKGRSPIQTLRGLIQLIRPRQWIKNGFVLAPLMFTGKFLDPLSVEHAFLATFLFSLAASATYVINDLRDIDRDRQHPKKSMTRPLASGRIAPSHAFATLFALYGILFWGWFQAPDVIYIIMIYLALNIAYSFVLKHEPVIDIFTIAIGFVLRVYAGAMALSVPVSSWMFITTLCLALFLAAVKRRQELSQSGTQGRKVLEKYSVGLIDRYAEMSATGALVFYSLFVMSSRPELTISIPLVLFGLFRYWFVVESLDSGESPTDALIGDWQLQLTILLWVSICGYLLWPA